MVGPLSGKVLKVYGDFSCPVHFQGAGRVKTYRKSTWMWQWRLYFPLGVTLLGSCR